MRRVGFTGESIEEDVLERILLAGHAAPSVGLSQPWDFIVIRSVATRTRFHAHVLAQREAFADTLPEDRRSVFDGIRIEGILESSLSVVVTYDSSRAGPAVLGRHTIADAGLYSVCLAIENIWLAATAEGLGLGWVSFYEEPFLSSMLELPTGIRPVAWLCLGPVDQLESVPDLERLNWRKRLDLTDVVHDEHW